MTLARPCTLNRRNNLLDGLRPDDRLGCIRGLTVKVIARNLGIQPWRSSRPFHAGIRTTSGRNVRIKGQFDRGTYLLPPRTYLLALTLAHRARWAAAIFLRLAAEIVRLGFPLDLRCFAHRAFCAKLILLRAAADIGRREPLGVVELP